MAGDLEEATVNCVDAWVAKLLDGKTLAESEVVQLCNKVRENIFKSFSDRMRVMTSRKSNNCHLDIAAQELAEIMAYWSTKSSS